MEDLICEIRSLLELGYEGGYWDFKSDYPDKNKKEDNIKSGKNGLIYLTIILSFTLGACLGSLFTNKFGTKSVWIAAGVLMFVNSFMFFEEV